MHTLLMWPQQQDTYLNLIMEFMPTSLGQFSEGYSKRKMQMPAFYVKVNSVGACII